MADSFTPGPWKVQLAKGSYQRPAYVETADGSKVVAGCFGNQLEPDATSIREAEANARLIAAAPELLEALAEVRTWISGWSPSFTHDDEWPATAKKMHDAISKATGAA